MNIAELDKLAEGWRRKAADLRRQFQAPHPQAQGASDAALCLEVCAEDLERWLREPEPVSAALGPEKK